MAALELADVTVVRSGQRLLDAISWRVEEDERWVVLGPNGAGKTTLLSVAAAQVHPTSGYAEVLGEMLGTVDVFELRPRIGLASAVLADRIPRDERVADLVLTAAYAVVGRWREDYQHYDEQQAQALLARMGVDHLADRTFGTLSEGERKRAQIARALMTDPELLLLDEPAAGLDLGAREALVATLDDLAGDPSAPAMVLVTHHVEEIPAAMTHALLLRSGRVVAAGPVEQTLTAASLSDCFGLPLQVERRNGRIVETFTLDLVFLMLAGGAVAGAVAAAFGAPLLLQAVVAVVASAALLGVVRPIARRHLRTPLETRTGVAALVGRDALVIARVDAHSGQVKLGGEVWSARAFDDHDVIEPGERVQVAEIEGATALVYRSGL